MKTLTGRRGVPDEDHDGRRLLQYLQRALAQNLPYDRMVRDMVTGSGLGDENGEVNFLLRYRADPVDVTGAVGRTLLGIRLQCAQCHDHPFAEWKQDQFWGMAAFFSKTRRFYTESGDEYLPGVIDVSRDRGMFMPGLDEREMPERAKVPPVYLSGDRPADGKWREQFADLLIDPTKSPTFAMNAVNRVWAEFFGRGLLEPLDGFTLRGAEVPPLLKHLADEFVANQYDLRRLIRTIALSKAYQREARAGADSYAYMPVRPLDEDQIFDAIVDATGFTDEPYDAEDLSPEEIEEEESYRDQQPREFFGEHDMSKSRALALLNHWAVHEAVETGSRTCVGVNGRATGPAHVEWLYLATLSRKPTKEETDEMTELIDATRAKRSRLADLLWALLNSAEFTTNH